MPEIKIKHVVSFSSEDKVHKAENLLKPETYRKWKCASPGEKNATIVLQFEKATQIHSIDIGNEGSAFVEVFVGRSSDPVSDYQILLVASSFMSPLESRNGTHTNRVRMFGPDALSHQAKDEKWDCVQVVCTQPFNKNIAYGLTFIKFHSPSEKIEEQLSNTKEEKSVTKLGAFNIKEEDENDSLLSIGSWFGKEQANVSESLSDVKTDAQNAVTCGDNNEGSLKMYFDEAEWNGFSDYEKERFVKIKRNYEQLVATGVISTVPSFALPLAREEITVGLKTNVKKNMKTDVQNAKTYNNEEESLKIYFSKAEWNGLCDYEKSAYGKIKRNYDQLVAMGINATVPTFMLQEEKKENRVGLKAKLKKSSSASKVEPSYASVILASSSNSPKMSVQDNPLKRKVEEKSDVSEEPPSKKATTTKGQIVYKDVLRTTPDVAKKYKNDAPSPKVKEKRKEPTSAKTPPSKDARVLRQRIPFNKIMDKVVFVLSGFVNPLRSELRDKALEMGAKYRPDWDPTCTHLVCAFVNTPKYTQVKKKNGRIVTKEWILDSYQKKVPLLWRKYELCSDSSDEEQDEEQDDSDKDPDFSTKNEKESDEESDVHESEEIVDEESDAHIIDESDEEDVEANKKKRVQKTKNQKKDLAKSPSKNILQSPSKQTLQSPSKKTLQSSNVKNALSTPTKRKHNVSDSENETDSPKQKSSFSIFNKLKESEEKHVSSNSPSPSVLNIKEESETEDEDALQDYIAHTDVEDDSGGDTEDEIRKWEAKAEQKKKLSTNGINNDTGNCRESDASVSPPLPQLPDFFKKKCFYLYGDFSSSKLHDLQRYIIAYDGNIEDYMNDKVKYVITEKKWDSNFDNALDENEDLIFVKPTWIYKCHESGKLVPYQPHIVIPDS